MHTLPDRNMSEVLDSFSALSLRNTLLFIDAVDYLKSKRIITSFKTEINVNEFRYFKLSHNKIDDAISVLQKLWDIFEKEKETSSILSPVTSFCPRIIEKKDGNEYVEICIVYSFLSELKKQLRQREGIENSSNKILLMLSQEEIRQKNGNGKIVTLTRKENKYIITLRKKSSTGKNLAKEFNTSLINDNSSRDIKAINKKFCVTLELKEKLIISSSAGYKINTAVYKIN